jgi:hypothetical protein
MPVPCMSMRERADYAFSGKPFYDQWIFIHVNVIIKIDKVVSQRLTEYGPGDCHQADANEKDRDR